MFGCECPEFVVDWTHRVFLTAFKEERSVTWILHDWMMLHWKSRWTHDATQQGNTNPLITIPEEEHRLVWVFLQVKWYIGWVRPEPGPVTKGPTGPAGSGSSGAWTNQLSFRGKKSLAGGSKFWHNFYPSQLAGVGPALGPVLWLRLAWVQQVCQTLTDYTTEVFNSYSIKKNRYDG